MLRRKIEKGIMQKKMSYDDWKYFTDMERSMGLTSVEYFRKLRPWIEDQIEKWRQLRKSIN
jgi:hypothetical protein